MLYNSTTGKRVKEPFNHINWAHKVYNLQDFVLQQCFFGTHLLLDDLKPVGLVESEKTALICSIYIPELTWLAVGGIGNLKAESCQMLAGRTVFLFPDLNAFDKWNEKMEVLRTAMSCTIFQISDLLERNATAAEKAGGLDLADYLLKFDLKEFRKSQSFSVNAKPSPIELPNSAGEKSEKSEGLKTNIFLTQPGTNLVL